MSKHRLCDSFVIYFAVNIVLDWISDKLVVKKTHV